jgi:hypothetical protein
MIPAKESSSPLEISSRAQLDAAQLDEIKRGRERTKARNEFEASLYCTRRITWEKGRKSEAMEEWSDKVMACNLSRKAVKAAWALTFRFNSVDGACFERKSKLAERASLSKQAFKDALTELEKKQLITRQKEARSGKTLTVIYPAFPDVTNDPYIVTRDEHHIFT